MRNNHIRHGVVFTLVGTLCLSICTAAPQTQSALLRQLVPHITSDAIGFDSGLWRSEYLQRPKQDKHATQASTSEVMTAVTTSGSAKSPPPAFVYSDKRVTIPLDTPALIEAHEFHANGGSDLQEETAMSR